LSVLTSKIKFHVAVLAGAKAGANEIGCTVDWGILALNLNVPGISVI
jgi:hypothetical protein